MFSINIEDLSTHKHHINDDLRLEAAKKILPCKQPRQPRQSEAGGGLHRRHVVHGGRSGQRVEVWRGERR